MISANALFWSSGRSLLDTRRVAKESHERVASPAIMWLYPVGNFCQVSAVMPNSLFFVPIVVFRY